MAKRVVQTQFFQWFPTLLEAQDIGDPAITEIRNDGFIQLAPDEPYTAISNYVDYDTVRDLQINFGDDYQVEVIDCCGSVLKDITANTTITQFNHVETGKYNIIFEPVSIGMLPEFYGRTVHFKITQTTNTSNVFYSTPFQINPNTRGTIRVAFRDYSVKFGNDYSTANVYQTIRLRAQFIQPKPETQNETYTQESGNVIRKGAVPVFSYEYLVEFYNNLGMKAFEYMRGHSEIYIDGYRATNIVQSQDERLGSSNFYTGKITVYKDLTDYKLIGTQITPDFTIIPVMPLGIYTLASFPTKLEGFSSSEIVVGEGTFTIYLSDGTIFHTFTSLDITRPSPSSFRFIIGDLPFTNGSYYVNWSYGFFTNLLGQVATIANGSWNWRIAAGQFKATQFKNDQFIVG